MAVENKNKNQNTSEEKEGMYGHETKLALARRAISHLKSQLENIERLLDSPEDMGGEELMDAIRSSGDSTFDAESSSIDGVFNGEHMIGEDGRMYIVPPNYASKSKLVEGDLLCMMIGNAGRCIFKQKGPIERLRLSGALAQDDVTGSWRVFANGQRYLVLPAAVSFFKGEVGDNAVILVPKDTPSKWAALENILKASL
jgi:hypothetical protein